MWTVLTTEAFDQWFDQQSEGMQEKVLAGLLALSLGGPQLGRPLVDSIMESGYSHMKELRVQYKGEPIRAFFAFDPSRQAIVLCAGNKKGKEKWFYKKMLAIADQAYLQHLQQSEGQ